MTSRGARARPFGAFWDLHAVVGLLGSLVLYAMFLLSPVALFRSAIELWQEPALHGADPGLSLQSRVDAVLDGPRGPREDFWLVLSRESPQLDRLVDEGNETSPEISTYLSDRQAIPRSRERVWRTFSISFTICITRPRPGCNGSPVFSAL